jgi:hypothetical protein
VNPAIRERLERYRLPLRLEEATAYLKSVRNRLEFLELYRHYFPEEWASSGASLTPGPGDRFSSREEEFLELVDARLFPLHTEYCLELLEEGEFPLPVPVVLQGLDWWNEDFQELRPAWQMLLRMAGLVENREEVKWPEIETLLSGANPRVDFKRLEQRCQKKGGPLGHLPLALRLLDHDTGCAFLDASEEGPGIEAWWEREDIDWLVAENRLAGEILEKIEGFLDWLEAAPGPNFKEVIKIWNRSL